MNRALFRSMLRLNGRTIASYAFGSALYLWLCIWLYPMIADANLMNEMLKTMPENFLSAFGLEQGIQGLNGFLAGEYYGLIFVLILMIYCVLMATQLLARLVDRGSMAFLLSTPASRARIAVTQAALLVFGLALIALLTTAAGLLGARWLVDTSDFDVSAFLQINLIGFLLFFVVGGYSFMISCIANDEKQALGISGLFTVLFFMANFAANMSEKLDWLHNVTPFSLFSPSDIAAGDVNVAAVAIGLAAAGIVFYALAVVIFKRRDLPL
ncbi:MAG TPA: ABC transporter permease subunit [Bacillales bacterium]|nr:ABC transporter permease subunit [Bacillales bacterium]